MGMLLFLRVLQTAEERTRIQSAEPMGGMTPITRTVKQNHVEQFKIVSRGTIESEC